MENETKHIIWQNYEIDPEDWYDEFIEQYPGLSENINAWEYATQCNEEYLEDERTNLDIELDHPIVIFADIGLWFGRRHGYRVIGSNISDCHLLVYRELLIDEDEFDELLYDDKFDPEKHCRKIGNRVNEVYGW